jgi:glycosyltransferase involved in cell wall biosynthesis
MPPIKIFTPSYADAANTNAQNLTVKEIVSRLPPDEFHVSMFSGPEPDARIAARPNTSLIPWKSHGNTVRFLTRLLWTRPDIYFYPRHGPLDSAFFQLRRVLRLRARVVTHIVMMMNDVTASGLTATSIREAGAVYGNSEYVAQTVRQVFNVKTEVMHNGIDRRFFFPPKTTASSRTPIVLYAGSFQARKRVDLIVREAARFPEVKFRMAGRGETENECRALAQHLGCRNVEFLGHISPSQLGEEMREAHIFMFPSILEGHPQVLGQAAACGLPSIAMDVYHPDYVVNGGNGFLVKSDEELSQKLELLLRDAALRSSMSKAAVEHARLFDWDAIALQWQKAFRAVMARH